jgi:hypothetical protein
MYTKTFPYPNRLRYTDISVHSSNAVDKKEIMSIVSNTCVYHITVLYSQPQETLQVV